jgi:hypothetical protein
VIEEKRNIKGGTGIQINREERFWTPEEEREQDKHLDVRVIGTDTQCYVVHDSDNKIYIGIVLCGDKVKARDSEVTSENLQVLRIFK